jgi:hypothetical protein
VLAVVIPAALGILTQWWDITKANLQLLWSFIQANVLPLLSALADVVGAVLKLAFEAIAGIVMNVVVPAVTRLWEWINEKVMPVVGQLAEWLREKLSPAFDRIGGAIQSVIGWLRDLAGQLNNVKLPDWMTPGSPTPWEIGLLGVADAFAELNRSQLPAFESRLELQAPALGNGLLLQPSPASLQSAPAASGGLTDRELINELMMMIRLPGDLARSNTVALQKVAISRTQ